MFFYEGWRFFDSRQYKYTYTLVRLTATLYITEDPLRYVVSVANQAWNTVVWNKIVVYDLENISTLTDTLPKLKYAVRKKGKTRKNITPLAGFLKLHGNWFSESNQFLITGNYKLAVCL